ncbi:hypothetical protein BJY00DRAFT_320159 [Aspergillus carlsbadensis]|nr:hypothetical protein BJY00DRAFT_320159 [Aspergillus carlsbadensis]
MAAVDIFKYPTTSPADTTPLSHLEKQGYDASSILAVIGKTEGNGCVNNFSRTLSSHVWESKIPRNAVTVFSGGIEGVLSPYVTFLVKLREPMGLVACSGSTRDFERNKVGAEVQAREVAGGICVAGQTPITTDTYKSMAVSRYASAVGIALALEKITPDSVAAALDAENEGVWSARASCSSSAELKNCHIMVLAADHKAEND